MSGGDVLRKQWIYVGTYLHQEGRPPRESQFPEPSIKRFSDGLLAIGGPPVKNVSDYVADDAVRFLYGKILDRPGKDRDRSVDFLR